MPYKVTWADPGATQLVLEIYEPYSVDDLIEMMKSCNAQIDEIGHPVNSLVDLTKAGAVPEGLLPRFSEISSLSNPNVMHTYIIVNSRIAELMIGLVGRLMGKMTVVNTRQEAIDSIRRSA